MQQQMTRITIPENVGFADLKLARNAAGMVTFDWSPIKRICSESGIDIELLRASEDNVSGLLTHWYMEHRKNGGEPDPVAEDLIAEVRAEDAAGQPFSFEAGRA